MSYAAFDVEDCDRRAGGDAWQRQRFRPGLGRAGPCGRNRLHLNFATPADSTRISRSWPKCNEGGWLASLRDRKGTRKPRAARRRPTHADLVIDNSEFANRVLPDQRPAAPPAVTNFGPHRSVRGVSCRHDGSQTH
jgi:hypothetical protein